MKDFTVITNSIGQLIQNDAEITQYCIDNLGSTLNGIDNPLWDNAYFPDYPNFIIGKEDESHYFNKAGGTNDTYIINIMFTGKFEAEQTSENLTLPAGAEAIINGVKTYTPSDIMRMLANKVGILMYNSIGCKVPGLLLETYSATADDYYSEQDGTVSSIIRLEFYENTRVSN